MNRVSFITIIALFIVGCSGNHKNNSETGNKEGNVSTQEKVTSENVKEEQPLTVVWSGASSRDDLKNKLSGTTWETTETDNLNMFHKLVISGSNVKEYSAKRPLNYDDPKKWEFITERYIYEVFEPEQGAFITVIQAKEGSGIYEGVPISLVFRGNECYYTIGKKTGLIPIILTSSK